MSCNLAITLATNVCAVQISSNVSIGQSRCHLNAAVLQSLFMETVPDVYDNTVL